MYHSCIKVSVSSVAPCSTSVEVLHFLGEQNKHADMLSTKPPQSESRLNFGGSSFDLVVMFAMECDMM